MSHFLNDNTYWTARFDSKGTLFSDLRAITQGQMWEHHPHSNPVQTIMMVSSYFMTV
jgi:hypothetical protein